VITASEPAAKPAHDPDIISKGEFASRRRVHPSRVSQWIKGGQISGDALVGEGREQRIREAVAVEQLRRRLDGIQRTANGQGTCLDLIAPTRPPLAAEPAQQAPAPIAAPAPRDGVNERIALERLEAQRRANRIGREEEALRAGKFILAEESAAQYARLSSDIVAALEGALGDMATSLASRFSLPPRDLLHALRAEFGAMRARLERVAEARKAAAPKFVEHELPTDDDADESNDAALGRSVTASELPAE
jgi:hypothetical protein